MKIDFNLDTNVLGFAVSVLIVWSCCLLIGYKFDILDFMIVSMSWFVGYLIASDIFKNIHEIN